MIWSIFKKEEARVPEFKTIYFGRWQYAPQPDITTHELAMLVPVFGTVMIRSDVKPYLVENNLTRHFIIPKDDIDVQVTN
jgi:uncharacterized protein (DUF427 family)